MINDKTMSKPSAKDSKSVLDSVLSDNGPMPAAHLFIRSQALVLDWIFVSVFTVMVIGFVMPYISPDALDESRIWSRDFADWVKQADFLKGIPMPQWSESLAVIMVFAQFFTFVAIWLYFAIGEIFFAGHSFGKSICRLRTISTVTMKKPLLLSAISRSGIKTLALLDPLIFLATTVVLGFNKRKQMGHDLLCRTAVVDERYMSSVDQIG